MRRSRVRAAACETAPSQRPLRLAAIASSFRAYLYLRDWQSPDERETETWEEEGEGGEWGVSLYTHTHTVRQVPVCCCGSSLHHLSSTDGEGSPVVWCL